MFERVSTSVILASAKNGNRGERRTSCGVWSRSGQLDPWKGPPQARRGEQRRLHSTPAWRSGKGVARNERQTVEMKRGSCGVIGRRGLRGESLPLRLARPPRENLGKRRRAQRPSAALGISA